MSFIPLHINTGYNFLKSGVLIDKAVALAKDYGYQYLGICDNSVMYGYPKFYKACKKNNLTPFFGMDVPIENFYISLYIRNEEGYLNLVKISNYLQTRKVVEIEFLKEHSKGLIAIYPTKTSLFEKIDDDLFVNVLSKYSSIFDFNFIGLEIYTPLDNSKANLIRNFSEQYNFKIIAYPLCKYLHKENAIVLELLKNIDAQSSFDYHTPIEDKVYYLKSKEEITSFYSIEELETFDEIIKNIQFEFLQKRGNLLHFQPERDSKDLLKEKIYEGLAYRNIDIKMRPNYRGRLNKEYLTIVEMGYADYFLIVQDYVLFAKKNNIPVGPGRGSAAGSLISYLLQITEVDPIKFNLLFERFLNPQRKTMPDIDIDFSDQKRDLVFSYLRHKYGSRRSARVIAFQTFGAKQALRDVTKAFGFPISIADSICKTIPNNYNQNNYDLDLAFKNIPAFREKINETVDYRAIFKAAHLIEGLPRQRGLHAAGLIIDNNNLDEIMPLTYEGEDEYVTQFEKDYLEEQGFLKMDLLGLTNLSTIDSCLSLIKKEHNIEINIDNIPYDDPKIYSLINDGKTMGIFQLDTGAAANALSYIKPKSFNDIVATISLDRPGPMEQIPLFSRRKDGYERIAYPDKSLENILKETYGIIVYQEQIMQICQAFAGFSFAEADLFRRAISKKNESEILKRKEQFFEGARKLHHQDNQIENIYDLILKFANYGFNKSHAVCYAMIACQEAYLKVNWGPEFYASILDQQYGSSDAKFGKYLAEIQKSNIKVLLPNINVSTLQFELQGNSLVMPLLGISGLQSRIAIRIVEERNEHGLFKSFIDFVTRLSVGLFKINETQLSKLVDAGCFDSLNPNRKSLKMSIPNAIQYAGIASYNQGKLFDNYGIDFQYVETEDDPDERIQNEIDAVGVMLSDSPLNHIDRSSLANIKITDINSLKNNYSYNILSIVRNIKVIQVKNGKDAGKPMAFLTLFDNTGEIEATLFASTYSLVGAKLKVNSIVLTSGRLQQRNGKFNLAISSCKILR